MRNLIGTPGARERDPAWSPDGKWIAYLSDQTGEYEIYVAGSDGRTAPRQVTTGGGTFRFAPRWSPDSKKLAFSDKTCTLWWCDVATGKLTKVDKGECGEIHDYAWAPDSKWLAYARPTPPASQQLQLYALGGAVTAVTTGMTDDFSPAFDPDGEYLYFISRRTLNPEFGAFELDFQFSATDKIYAMSLRDTLLTPVPPQSDEEAGEAKKDEGGPGKDGQGGQGRQGRRRTARTRRRSRRSRSRSRSTWTASRRASRRCRCRPAATRACRRSRASWCSSRSIRPSPTATTTAPARSGSSTSRSARSRPSSSGVDAAGALSKDGGKLLYKSGDTYGIVDVAEGKKSGDGKLATGAAHDPAGSPRRSGCRSSTRPGGSSATSTTTRAWAASTGRPWASATAQLVPYVAHRADLNYILGELHRRALHLARLRGRRRRAAGPARGRRPARRRLRAGRRERPLPLRDRSTGRATGTRTSRRRSACPAST